MLNSAYFENMVLYSTLLNKIHLTWLYHVTAKSVVIKLDFA